MSTWRERTGLIRARSSHSTHGNHTSVGKDAVRKRPPSCSKLALDLAMDFVAEREGCQFMQADLAHYLNAVGEYQMGTAQGYASGALLMLREEGLVRWISGGPGQPQRWEVV